MKRFLKTAFIVVATIFLTLCVYQYNPIKTTHIETVVVDKSYDEVWEVLSNPLLYNDLYPHWIKAIEKTGQNTYQYTMPHVDNVVTEMTVTANKKFGIIDLYIEGETSQARLVPIGDEKTAYVHVGYRWPGFNLFMWLMYKWGIHQDFKNTKSYIEAR